MINYCKNRRGASFPMGKTPQNSVHPYLVPALERGFRVLELLSLHPAGLTMAEMNSLELPPASLYRLLVTLSELGYVIRDDHDRYRLGRKLLTLGYRSVDEMSLVEKALSPMRDLRDRTGIVQLAFDESTPRDVFDKAFAARSEYARLGRPYDRRA